MYSQAQEVTDFATRCQREWGHFGFTIFHQMVTDWTVLVLGIELIRDVEQNLISTPDRLPVKHTQWRLIVGGLPGRLNRKFKTEIYSKWQMIRSAGEALFEW